MLYSSMPGSLASLNAVPHHSGLAQRLRLCGGAPVKTCRDCHISKPFQEFHRDKTSDDGHVNLCKLCKKAYNELWYQRNFVRIQDRKKSHYHKHKDEIKVQHKTYYENNKKRLKPTMETYRKEHVEESRQMKRRWRLAHLEHLQILNKIWRLNNPEKRRANHARRRALKQQATVIEKVEIALIFMRDRGICSICGKKVQRKEATLDHIIPLSRGGNHSYQNSSLAHGRCNS